MAHAINVVNLCREFNCLPYEGGLMDQPHLWVRTMSVVVEGQSKAEEKKRAQQAQKNKRPKGG